MSNTSEEKRAILDRLLKAWEMVPEQRLGQLLSAAYLAAGGNGDLYFVVDSELTDCVEHYAYPRRRA